VSQGGKLLVARDRLEELGEQVPALRRLRGADVVLTSGVQVKDQKDPRHTRGNLAAALSSVRAGVPHIYMVDAASNPGVRYQLNDIGVIAVPLLPEEGGRARPHIIAAQLVDHFAGFDAISVKLEGDKNITADPENKNIRKILAAASENAVVTCGRSLHTFLKMPPYQRLAEAILATAIRNIADVPYDVASGVLALNGAGREVFYGFDGDDWSYLIHTPNAAEKVGAMVGGVQLDFTYPPEMVAAERGNKDQDGKRRMQLDLMLEAAVFVAGGLDNLEQDQLEAYEAAKAALSGLEELATL